MDDGSYRVPVSEEDQGKDGGRKGKSIREEFEKDDEDSEDHSPR